MGTLLTPVINVNIKQKKMQAWKNIVNLGFHRLGPTMANSLVELYSFENGNSDIMKV